MQREGTVQHQTKTYTHMGSCVPAPASPAMQGFWQFYMTMHWGLASCRPTIFSLFSRPDMLPGS
eukprot:1151876-Pelagomonas_calceolata.AAC.3